MRSVELRVVAGTGWSPTSQARLHPSWPTKLTACSACSCPHATAGVALIETGAGTEPDLADALERLLPTADIYRHRHGSLGHGRDHVMPRSCHRV